MAKARMLHKKISVSSQVNKLSTPAELLFSWAFSHADDDGRLKGDPESVKATVVPMKKWSVRLIKKYLEEMVKAGLIHYWSVDNEWFIEFVKWREHQQIRKDRYIPSLLPSFSDSNDNRLTTNLQPSTNKMTTQYNSVESSEIELNKRESSSSETIADKLSFKIVNPQDFIPANELEAAALESWRKLEANNPFAFQTTYLSSARKGLPAKKFFEFTSEIIQDKSVESAGAVFRTKVDSYLSRVGSC